MNEKGVYFCELYKNTKDFLCGNIDESKLEKKEITIEKIMDWWKPKAIKR